MEIFLEDINELIKGYVPAIVNALLLSSHAAGCGRDMTDAECNKVIESINEVSATFVEGYSATLKEYGAELTEEEENELRDTIAENILLTAHFLLEDATEQLKRRVWEDLGEEPPGAKTGGNYYA